MTCLKKIKNKHGFSLIEALIALAILSLVLTPAYMALLNGFKIFGNEKDYQTAIADVQFFYDEVNSKIRLAGFKDTEYIDTTTRLDQLPGVKDTAPRSPVNVLRVKDTYYYVDDGALNKYYDNNEYEMLENVLNFVIDELEDGQLITLSVTVEVRGRQRTIETEIYDRY